MKDFKTLPSNPLNGGIQYIYKAKNGYGASIVKHDFSYGNKNGLWELAVTDSEGLLTYDTPITNDVMGYLSDKDVNDTLIKISKLKK